MAKAKLEYTEKHHILEVDGIEYEVPQRTAELAEKVREHDEAISKMSEYESNMNLLEIFFGKEAAAQMFPDKKTTNLDKLAKCAKMAAALFMADYNAMQVEELNSKFSELEPALKKIEDVRKTTAKINDMAAVQRARKK